MATVEAAALALRRGGGDREAAAALVRHLEPHRVPIAPRVEPHRPAPCSTAFAIRLPSACATRPRSAAPSPRRRASPRRANVPSRSAASGSPRPRERLSCSSAIGSRGARAAAPRARRSARRGRREPAPAAHRAPRRAPRAAGSRARLGRERQRGERPAQLVVGARDAARAARASAAPRRQASSQPPSAPARSQRLRQPVADSAHVHDVGAPRARELLAQPARVRVHRARRADRHVAPHVAQQVVLRHHAASGPPRARAEARTPSPRGAPARPRAAPSG